MQRKAFKQLALANWLELVRDPKTILYILIPPLMIVGFFWFFSSTTTVSSTVLVSVPSDAEEGVHQAVALLAQTPKMRVETIEPEEAERIKESGDYEALVSMPQTLENGAITIDSPPDSKVPVWLIQSILSTATRKAGSPTVFVEATGGEWNLDPKRFGIPGALIYALSSLALFGLATPIVNLRQKGVLRLIGTTPVPRLVFLMAQVPARLGIATVMILLAVAVSHFYEPLTFGKVLAAVGTALLGFIMLASIGYAVGGTATSAEAATNVVAFLLPVSLMLGGIFIPLELMPDWFVTVSKFVPITYLGDALRHQLFRANTIAPLWFGHLVMFLTTCMMTYVAVRFFKWDAEHRDVAQARER